MNLKDLTTRAGAGILYILVILIGILGGPISFLIVFGGVLCIGLFEFYRMVEKDTSHDISKIFNIVMGLLIFMSVFLYIKDINTIVLPVLILIYLLLLFATSIFIRREDILHGIIYSVFGQLYVTMPLSILMLTTEYQAPLLALFIFIWVNDTAAYFFGSLIGKNKLIEHISPKKSVEGFIAGIVFTLLAALVFNSLYPEFSIIFWLGYALIVTLFGTLGDLFESLIKRTCNVKDTGQLIPGHGGILDRIDSLLIAAPAIYLYMLIIIEL